MFFTLNSQRANPTQCVS